MALSFYALEDVDRQRPLICLEVRECDQVTDVLQQLQRKTGVFVDPYGTTRVYPDHFKLLSEILAENPEAGTQGATAKRKLKFGIDSMVASGKTVVAEGD